jgi:hypothetical protein
MLSQSRSHFRSVRSSSRSRRTAILSGFFDFSQVLDGPLRYGESSRLETIPSLRGGHRLPSRVGVWNDLQLVVVRRAGRKVGFKYRQREIFPILSLAQEGAALKGTEGRGLTVQGSYRAILAHVFQDDFPTHMHELTPLWPSPCSLRLWATTIFEFVSGRGRKPEWFPNS